MMVPTVHMNGTAPESLIESFCEASHALHEAGRKLAATCPNGRDYYPQGNDAIQKAMQEHSARMDKIREICRELQALADAVLDQQRGGKR